MDWTLCCRFCLQVNSTLTGISQKTYNVIRICLGMELRQFVECKICYGCSKTLEVVSEFRLMCLENEDRMLSDLYSSGAKLDGDSSEEETPKLVVATEVILPEQREELEFAVIKEEDIEMHFLEEPVAVMKNMTGPRKRKQASETLCEDVDYPVKAKKRQKIVETPEEKWKRHRKIYIPRKKDMENCTKCHGAFRNLKLHQMYCQERDTPNKFVQCEICHNSFKFDYIQTHMNVHDQVCCHICSRKLTKPALPFHLVQHKTPDEFTEEDFQKFGRLHCKVCDRFVSNLKKHHSYAHGDTENEMITCEICGKVGPRKILRHHIRDHKVAQEQVEPFTCDLCGKQIRGKKTSLKAHMEYVHLQIKRAECKLCNKKFSTYGLYQEHCKQHHQEHEFKCSLCNKGFSRQFQLDIHVEAVHIRSGNHACNQCDAKYNSKTALKYHVSTTHENGKYTKEKASFSGTCICGVEFNSRANFSQHLKDDHKRLDGLCYCISSCGRVYQDMAKLRVHMQRYHKFKCIFHRGKGKPENKSE